LQGSRESCKGVRSRAKRGAHLGKLPTRCFCSPAASVAGDKGLYDWKATCHGVKGEVCREEETRAPARWRWGGDRGSPTAVQGKDTRELADCWVSCGGLSAELH